VRLAIGCGLGVLLGAGLPAAPALAAAVPFSGELAIRVGTLAPVTYAANGTAIVNGSGGGIEVDSLALAASLFHASGTVFPVTDPGAAPITGIRVTAVNGTAAFAGGTGSGTLGGAMALLGSARVCLFGAGACTGSLANLSVPLSVVGTGGTATAAGAVNVTVIGAPWTTGTAAAGSLSAMGFAQGPASAPGSTALASGVLRLVTPIFVSTNLGGGSVVPAFGFLTLHFVPEPGTLALAGAGLAAVAAAARRRRGGR
jgi:hypothetical protein